jgi:hypothetical protein
LRGCDEMRSVELFMSASAVRKFVSLGQLSVCMSAEMMLGWGKGNHDVMKWRQGRFVCRFCGLATRKARIRENWKISEWPALCSVAGLLLGS